MKTNATKLRKNLYRILDGVIETGIPVEVERKGKTVKIIIEEKKSKLDNLEAHNVINGNPMDIVHIDWSDEWKGL
jgi:hypothetical protein